MREAERHDLRLVSYEVLSLCYWLLLAAPVSETEPVRRLRRRRLRLSHRDIRLKKNKKGLAVAQTQHEWLPERDVLFALLTAANNTKRSGAIVLSERTQFQF